MAQLSENLTLAQEWSPTFKILGDPTRLKLLTSIHFAGQYVYTVTELAEATNLQMATVSASLRAMEKVGVVKSARQGRSIKYAIANDDIHKLLHWMGVTHQN
ncbi:ArsR/SmtB family transcription factor [Varibaculum prostatecancerukia]|uniref:ArsR/SmtB family transcription factor n=1 Tax=Varibaculum prostatecancerukia TaxID=2811781 RepID=UPI001C00389B|nr:metalloregulator ArsR/SmtB family transcription factor [Varibaculum prostatecancerukia]